MFLSAILTFYIPRLLGVTSYGYWQLYVFYLSYAGFFHFGVIDGLYLKIGGEHYEDLDKSNIKGQLIFLIIFEIIVALLLIIFSIFFIEDINKKIIVSFVSISGFFTIIRSFVLYLLQATNKIKEYAKLTKLDRYIYFFLAMGYVILGGRNYIILIVMDVFSRFVVLFASLNVISDIIKTNTYSKNTILKELFENIQIGIKLMFGNIAGQLILGVIRFSIEKKWSVEVFGQLSLTLSISNMILVFVSSISVVMFPILRRAAQDKLPKVFSSTRRLLTLLCYFALIFYPLLSQIILMILPKYQQSIYFMSIIFPIFIFESRMSLITMTFLKTLRKEKNILVLNIFALFLSLVLCYINVFLIESLTLTILSIVVILAFRAFLGDVILARELKTNITLDLTFESILTATFIFANMNNVFYIYIILFFFVFIFNLKNLKRDGLFFYSLLKN